jgi:hypothetical protein
LISKPRCPAVVVTELESGLRASVVMLEMEAMRTGVSASGAAELLERHRGRVELVIGGVAMRLLAGRELLDALESVVPRVPVLLASTRWPGLAGQRLEHEHDELPLVPFDAAWVRDHLGELYGVSDAA